MTKTTSSLLLAGVLSATLMTSVNVRAEEAAAAAPASPHTFTANVGIFNDYLFRGVSYGKERGAIQGGIDYSHSSGLYLGVWSSSIEKESLAGNTTEIDLYGGYVYPINADLSLNVGFLQFYYPNHKTCADCSSQNT
ncbi:MAG: TorF family putative porin, partial [Candidatus Methylopumilus sp.]